MFMYWPRSLSYVYVLTTQLVRQATDAFRMLSGHARSKIVRSARKARMQQVILAFGLAQHAHRIPNGE